MNIKVIEATHSVAQTLVSFSQEEQQQILSFLSEMIKHKPAATVAGDLRQLVSYQEASEIIGCSPSMLYGWVGKGRLNPIAVEGEGKKLDKSEVLSIKKTYKPRNRK